MGKFLPLWKSFCLSSWSVYFEVRLSSGVRVSIECIECKIFLLSLKAGVNLVAKVYYIKTEIIKTTKIKQNHKLIRFIWMIQKIHSY